MRIKTLLKYLVAWRVIILLIAIPAIFLIPMREGYAYLDPGFSLKNLSWMWANFDGFYYKLIAQFGYGVPTKTGFTHAFFPLYPIIIRFLSRLLPEYQHAAMLVSHLSLSLAAYFLYQLLKKEFSPKLARTTVLLMAVFPTAFFLGSVYTESLFLLLSILVFYFARRQQWLLAAIAVALVSATRITGIFLFVSLIIEYFQYRKKNQQKLLSNPNAIWLLLAPIGLLTYLYFLNKNTGDPFYFASIQPLFGANREVGRIILLYQVFFRYSKMLLFTNPLSTTYFIVLLEAATGTLFAFLSIISIKKLRPSYSFYLAASFILPTLTGTFQSVPRFVLVLFPGFILLAQWYNRSSSKVQKIYLTISILLAIVSITLFTRGYFVS